MPRPSRRLSALHAALALALALAPGTAAADSAPPDAAPHGMPAPLVGGWTLDVDALLAGAAVRSASAARQADIARRTLEMAAQVAVDIERDRMRIAIGPKVDEGRAAPRPPANGELLVDLTRADGRVFDVALKERPGGLWMGLGEEAIPLVAREVAAQQAHEVAFPALLGAWTLDLEATAARGWLDALPGGDQQARMAALAEIAAGARITVEEDRIRLAIGGASIDGPATPSHATARLVCLVAHGEGAGQPPETLIFDLSGAAPALWLDAERAFVLRRAPAVDTGGAGSQNPGPAPSRRAAQEPR